MYDKKTVEKAIRGFGQAYHSRDICESIIQHINDTQPVGELDISHFRTESEKYDFGKMWWAFY